MEGNASDPGRDDDATPTTFESVYDELRRLARRQLRGEAAGHTLDSVALVHEAYLRLRRQEQVGALARGPLLALASRAMRHVLVDHARARLAAKRGQAPLVVTLDPELASGSTTDAERLLALHEALQQLEATDAEAARVVELRYFAGLTHPEVADALGLATITARRRWEYAKAWLARALSERDD